MWSRSPPLRERMMAAARNAKVPVFFIQAENDADTSPTLVLSQAMTAAGKPARAHVFPPHGKTIQDGHGFCVDGDERARRVLADRHGRQLPDEPPPTDLHDANRLTSRGARSAARTLSGSRTSKKTKLREKSLDSLERSLLRAAARHSKSSSRTRSLAR
jgi:hypothetical protein